MPSFSDIKQNSAIVIACPKGLSEFLKQDVESMGFRPTNQFATGVSIRGSITDCVRLNLSSAFAHHVLLLIKEFHCDTPDTLYKEALAVDWENIIPPDGYVCVTSVVHNDSITDTRFANVKCKDAIVDRLNKKCGKRCDSGSKRDRTVVHLYWHETRCLLYIDTSGESLSKRGYRKNPGGAPMQETLAAAVVCATGWRGKDHFINPMCGAGTLAIEAALKGLNIAPGLLRNNFGFMHLASFDENHYRKLRLELSDKKKNTLEGKIIATDRDASALAAAKENAHKACIERVIDFDLCDFAETTIPSSAGSGVVLINPEYGFRMGNEEQLKNVYKQIGNFFKHQCGGYKGFVFTGNTGLAKFVGLKSKRKIPFLSGKIECRLYEYDLYAGRRG